MNDNSSYVKIFTALTQTDNFKLLEEKFTGRLIGAKVKPSFQVEPAEQGEVFIGMSFTVHYDVKIREYIWNSKYPANWTLTPSKLILKEETSYLLDTTFGKGKEVKTRGCKREVLEDGNRRTGHRSFNERTISFMLGKYGNLFTETHQRLKAWCTEFVHSEECYVQKNEFTVRACKNAIRNALLQWRRMPEEVLKDAWNQFIAADIMDEV